MTSRTLYLLRHGAATGVVAGGDAERPLSADGRAHVARLSRHLIENNYGWDIVLSSSALRARLTVAALEAVAPTSEVRVDERLYLTTPELQLACLRELSEEVTRVLMVGHNPTMRALGLALATPGGTHYQRLSRDLPAGGFLVLDVSVATWSGIGPKSAYLTDFVTPASLID